MQAGTAERSGEDQQRHDECTACADHCTACT